MKRSKFLLLTSFIVIWTILTITALTLGNRFDWPDNVHVDYGFPFVWSTNTLSTISGAVNLWIVDISVLIMNLGLWLGIMLIIEEGLLYFLSKK